ncbi:hypothetical protein [Alloscardovia omnicolens]|uniref:hypothetical protein n=1 Tax=Alloscardovia omnicolens TaxID=419015 RepID=UPI003A6CA0BD
MTNYEFTHWGQSTVDIHTYPNGDKLLTIKRTGLLNFLLFGTHNETKVLTNTIDAVKFTASHHKLGSMKFKINGKKSHDSTIYFLGKSEQESALALYDELSDLIQK